MSIHLKKKEDKIGGGKKIKFISSLLALIAMVGVGYNHNINTAGAKIRLASRTQADGVYSRYFNDAYKERSASWKNNKYSKNANDATSVNESGQTVASEPSSATTDLSGSAPTAVSTPVVEETTAAPVTTVQNQPVSSSQASAGSQVEWGAYTGWQASELADFEKRIGSPVDHQAVFIHWGNENEFPFATANPLKASGKTLIIYWEAMDYNIDSYNQPQFNADSILSGKWDSYIKSFAADAKAYGGKVILIPFEELNGNWYPSSGTLNGNTPEKMILAYRHIHDLFKDATNVKFGWAVNSVSVPDTANNAITKYYPGDEYVDIVGVDGFNFGQPWLSFDQIFGKALATLKTYNKPIYIFSMSCADGANKASWIKDALGVQIPKHPEIKGWVWFNENKERNWLVWSDAASLDAFKDNLPK